MNKKNSLQIEKDKSMFLGVQLIWAIKAGDFALAKELIDTGADVNMINPSGDSILHLALKLRNKDAIKLLLNCGADVDRENEYGETPLYIASRNARGDREYKKIVRILLDHGASLWPISCNKYCYVPLRYMPLYMLMTLFQTVLFCFGISLGIIACIFIDRILGVITCLFS